LRHDELKAGPSSLPVIFSDLVGEFASSWAWRLDVFAKVLSDARPMRLSTWLILGLSAAHIVDMLGFGGG
jgi:hypothetical protein